MMRARNLAAPSPTQPVVRPLPSGVKAATKPPSSVANATDGATTYTVTIFFTMPGATVINWTQTKVNVKAGGTAKWLATKDFTTGPQLTCVLRSLRRQVLI